MRNIFSSRKIQTPQEIAIQAPQEVLKTPQEKFIEGVVSDNGLLITEALQQGVNINEPIPEQYQPTHYAPNSKNPLMWACLHGNLQSVQRLLESGADPKISDEHMQTPLHWVAQYNVPNALEIAKLLVEHGADVNVLDRKGENPLFWLVAREDGDISFARFLIAKGSKTNIQDPNGYTPLILALSNGQAEMVSLLLQEGNARTDLSTKTDGHTALHIALGNCEGSIPLLLRFGANRFAKNAKGRTPLQCAASFGSNAFKISSHPYSLRPRKKP